MHWTLRYLPRLLGSVALLWAVHGETGPWTTVAVAMSMLQGEVAGLCIRRVAQHLAQRKEA